MSRYLLQMFKPRARNTAFGTRRIVRDSYRGLEWYKIIKEVAERDQHTCTEPGCGKYLGPGKGDVHHIRPLSKGGTTTKFNLRLVCSDCHKKHHKHMQ